MRPFFVLSAFLFIKETAAEVENDPTAAPVSRAPVAEPCALQVTVDCFETFSRTPCDQISFRDEEYTEKEFKANDCGGGVTITYEAKNVGSEQIDLTSWMKFVNGNGESLLGPIPDTTLDPGQSFDVTEEFETYICSNVFYCLEVTGQADGVDGGAFDAMDGYSFFSRENGGTDDDYDDDVSAPPSPSTCSTDQTCTIITPEPTAAPTVDPFTFCVSSCESVCSTEKVCSQRAQRRRNCVNKCAEEKCVLPSNQTEQEDFVKKVTKAIQQSCFVNIGLKVPTESPTFVPTSRPTTAPTSRPTTAMPTSSPTGGKGKSRQATTTPTI